MSNEETPVRRGEAAYRAQRDDIAKRNEAARKAARERNEGEQRRAAATNRAEEIRERQQMADSVD
jgi:hypothetical protein